MKQIELIAGARKRLIKGFGLVALPLLVLLGCIGSIPMSWQQQGIFGALTVGVALVIGRAHGRLGTLMLVMLSMCATARYGMWRIGSLQRYFTSPWQAVDRWNAVFMVLLLLAELYSFLILYLGYMQTIAPLRRPVLLMPAEASQWPTVDLFIPTFNEPLEVVRYTVLAAKQLDWPEDKLNIWLLDDGARQAFRDFAAEAAVGYIARPEHTHAKAGNINYALKHTSGDLIAIFDCDHVPTRSFLQVTSGWFLRDARLAMLQTPHHFYSPDPFERNLGNFRRVPNEGELFYGVIQDTNDFWNATFFCGSCAVLRRTALDEVGGIAHETVTEDAHTSLRMQQRGWNTAYINLPQAGGLATETLGDHVKQRVRWARGMAQILRIDNPLFSRKLNFTQRLCYLNAMLHFMYAVPRLIFLSAPILYLVFGKLNIPGYWLTILVFGIPHLLLSMITNSRVQGMKRYSFWNEIYETVLSPYILLPTLFALVSPKFGKFNVTAKGQNQQEDYFDSKLARPFLALLGLNVFGLGMAIPRYLYWDRGHTGTIIMNVVWTLFNIVILGVILSLCSESRQRRQAVRVTVKTPVTIERQEGICSGLLEDISVTGASAIANGRWNPNETVRVWFPTEDPDAIFRAHVVAAGQNRVRFAFDIATIEDQEAITRVVYLKADRWLNWTDGRRRDSVLGSLFAVFAASAGGFSQFLGLLTHKPQHQKNRLPALAAKTAAALLVIAALLFFLRTAHGESSRISLQTSSNPALVKSDLPFAALGAKTGVLLDPTNRNQGLAIGLPNNVFVREGTLHIKYTLPKSDSPSSTLEVLWNDTMLAAVTPGSAELAARRGEVTVPLPADLLVRKNQLTVRLADTSAAACNGMQAATAPIHIDADSSLTLVEERLVLASDLSLLPEPFVQRTATQPTKLPMVFGHQPATRTLEAAGVLVSWFGSEEQTGQTSYTVSLNELPKGNAVVMLVGGETLPALNLHSDGSARITIVANPVDPYGKLLVFSARTPEELVSLTQALALGQVQLSGSETDFGGVTLPARRSPDDAPRWIHTSRVGLESLNNGNPVQTTDSKPWTSYLRFSPDYNYGPERDIYLHLVYGNDATSLDPRSNLAVRLNGVAADSVPVRAADSRASQVANVALGSLPASAFANTLQMQFFFVPPSDQTCGSHFAGTLGTGSYLDLGKPVHLAKLPNLHLFSVAGFPFTRIADLGQTVALVSGHASPAELTLYLDLLGYIGSQTGYPTLRIEVANPEEAARYKDKDLLIIGKYADLASVPAVAGKLPLQFRDNTWQLSTIARMVETVEGWIQGLREPATDEVAWQDRPGPDGVIEQVQSPFSRDRSAVLLLGKDAPSIESMTEGLLSELPHDGISGTVSLWQDGRFVSHAYSTPTYYLGDASLVARSKIILAEYPWALLLGLLAAIALLALWVNACIHYRIRKRMMGVEFDLDGNPNSATL